MPGRVRAVSSVGAAHPDRASHLGVQALCAKQFGKELTNHLCLEGNSLGASGKVLGGWGLLIGAWDKLSPKLSPARA